MSIFNVIFCILSGIDDCYQFGDKFIIEVALHFVYLLLRGVASQRMSCSYSFTGMLDSVILLSSLAFSIVFSNCAGVILNPLIFLAEFGFCILACRLIKKKC